MTATVFRLFLLAGLCAPADALAARSDWSAAEKSQLRLLLADPEGGRIEGGVEIVLEPGWYTYWRNPGEAGVPPVFDFSRSENIADVEVRYPAPQRYDDGASVSLIYRDEVVFPIEVTPLRPGQPVTLHVDASFGVCREVCIPTATSSSVTMPLLSQPDPLTAARLQRYLPLVPKAAEPGRFSVENVTLQDEALLIDVRTPHPASSDLFADPPSGWFIGQPTFVSRADDVSRYRLSLAGRPRDAAVRGQRFRFVAVSGGEAIEDTVEIH